MFPAPSSDFCMSDEGKNRSLDSAISTDMLLSILRCSAMHAQLRAASKVGRLCRAQRRTAAASAPEPSALPNAASDSRHWLKRKTRSPSLTTVGIRRPFSALQQMSMSDMNDRFSELAQPLPFALILQKFYRPTKYFVLYNFGKMPSFLRHEEISCSRLDPAPRTAHCLKRGVGRGDECDDAAQVHALCRM